MQFKRPFHTEYLPKSSMTAAIDFLFFLSKTTMTVQNKDIAKSCCSTPKWQKSPRWGSATDEKTSFSGFLYYINKNDD